jgi:hypothetical protein
VVAEPRKARRSRIDWQALEWPLVWLLAAVAGALGYIGFGLADATHGATRSAADRVYLTLQLFILESGTVAPPVPWPLGIARFLAPGVAAYTATKALAVVFADQIQLLRVRLWKRPHVVICGLGRKGAVLVRGWLARGSAVVVIERDEDNDHIATARRAGAVVFVGSATEDALLRRARVGRASHVVAVCGDDGANAEVAFRVRGVCTGMAASIVTCHAHIVDPRLCSLLREREISRPRTGDFRLEFFNVFESGARALLEHHPFLRTWPPTRPPCLLVVGMGRLGESLVLDAAREWRDARTDRTRMRTIVVDLAARARTEVLRLRCPPLDSVCEIVPLEMDVRSPAFESGDVLFEQAGQPVDCVYVCFDNDARSLAAALALGHRARPLGIPVVARTVEEAGLATLLERSGPHDGTAVRAFGLLDRSCTPDVLEADTTELLARAIHADYVREQVRGGASARENASLVPWDLLPETLKAANRGQADGIGSKLQAVGCDVVASTNWDLAPVVFSAAEIEMLARAEHDRWMAERRRDGWTYAPGPKNVERKTHPALVPWEDLGEDMRELDRRTVRALPAFLARAGLHVFRRAEGPPGVSARVSA